MVQEHYTEVTVHHTGRRPKGSSVYQKIGIAINPQYIKIAFDFMYKNGKFTYRGLRKVGISDYKIALIRDAMVKKKWLEYVDEFEPRAGFRVTDPGWDVIRAIAQNKITIPTPSADEVRELRRSLE